MNDSGRSRLPIEFVCFRVEIAGFSPRAAAPRKVFCGGSLGLAAAFAALLLAGPAKADVYTCKTLVGTIASCTGSLSSPEDVFTYSFTLASGSTITVQTYGFYGGTNAAGTAISPGGFDPLVALFSGVAASATMLTDGGGNPIASADSLINPITLALLFSPGCPPAGTVTVGTVPNNCGDDRLTEVLGSGTYTLLLTDANFVPMPVNPGIVGPVDLTDTASNNYGSFTGNGAYNDLTAGVFQTCVDPSGCNTDTANFAVDILRSPTSPVPEPASFGLLISAVAVLIVKEAAALPVVNRSCRKRLVTRRDEK